MRYRVIPFVIGLTVIACGGKQAADGGAPAPAPARRQQNLVTADEISAYGGTNLYNIIRALRPTWFRIQPTHITGTTVAGDPVTLYVDGRRIGTASQLVDVPLNVVASVKFYSPSEAQGRFGLGNLSGAIEVTTTTAP
jgi:hypothetical protein